MRNRLRPLRSAFALLLFVFPLSLWWKAATMRASEGVITKVDRPVDPPVFWAFSVLLFVAGAWAIGKAMSNANYNRKDRILVSIFIGAFFFSSSAAVAMIAASQSQLMGGFPGQ